MPTLRRSKVHVMESTKTWEEVEVRMDEAEVEAEAIIVVILISQRSHVFDVIRVDTMHLVVQIVY